MTNQTRTEPLDRLAELEQAAAPVPWDSQRTEDADPNAVLYGPDGDSIAYLAWNPGNDYDMPATAAFIAALRNAAPSLIAEAREAARLRSALTEIADASRQRSECPTPGNCMYPQHHSDDESGSEHAERLRQMARAALVRP